MLPDGDKVLIPTLRTHLFDHHKIEIQWLKHKHKKQDILEHLILSKIGNQNLIVFA